MDETVFRILSMAERGLATRDYSANLCIYIVQVEGLCAPCLTVLVLHIPGIEFWGTHLSYKI